jgi:hypothetical protein
VSRLSFVRIAGNRYLGPGVRLSPALFALVSVLASLLVVSERLDAIRLAAIYSFLGTPFLDEDHHRHIPKCDTHTTVDMHFSTMVQHATAKVRPRSMQFDKSPMAPEPRGRRPASRDASIRPPAPGTRTSSLPLTTPKQYADTPVRYHRSMLEVERPPKLPAAKPLSYGELYPNAPEPPPPDRKALLRMVPDSQAPRVSQHSISRHC